ncbi:hypothetical protein Ahy_B02g059366 [Arachis hypogaea]|uniref:Uncharacterized protein n=1 Tax=Arachis hypogaea TaxID=3818 RepID=A0A445AGJ6_ARAHY|nr:hypothetical protein Ahy_B02g059366 [Arachis hypogaea]
MGLLRNNEAEADYYTSYGFPIMQTQVQALERSDATVYTREVFYLFRSLLLKASTVIIVDWRENSCSVNYDVRKYCELTQKWVVSYWPDSRYNHRNCRRGDDHNQMESGDGGGLEDDDDWSSQTSEEGIDQMDFDVTTIIRKASIISCYCLALDEKWI